MTSVTTTANPTRSKVLLVYTVEVITFDGDSIIEEIEAYSEIEAQRIAAKMVLDADYIMVQGSYRPW